MKCEECNKANICLDHIRFPSICGCRSGIPGHKVTTNADRIRNMSDEEMAERIASSSNFNCADYCDSFSDGCAFRCNRKERELELVLKWLQSEAE